jgi:hypothetical protein
VPFDQQRAERSGDFVPGSSLARYAQFTFDEPTKDAERAAAFTDLRVVGGDMIGGCPWLHGLALKHSRRSAPV